VTEVESGRFEIRRGAAMATVTGQTVALNSRSAMALAADKPAVYRLLTDAGLPIPEQLSFAANDLGAARVFLARDGPCVVKPARGTGGDGVTGEIRTASELRRAALAASRFSPQLLIESQVEGEVFRLLVLDGQVLDVVRRRHPAITGDGRSTVEELIFAEHDRRIRGEGSPGLKPFIVDLDCILSLKGAGITLRTVLPEGTTLRIKTVTNYNSPEDNETFRGPISPALTAEVVAAAEVLGLRLAGVDVVTPTPTAALAASGGAIIDVNETPGSAPPRTRCRRRSRDPRRHSDSSCAARQADRAPRGGRAVRYAVTGAAGFIGSHLAEALLATGHEVVGIDCFTNYYDRSIKEENARGIDVRRLDLAEDPLEFSGLDGIFHLAGQPGVRSFGDVFPSYLRRNVHASQRVFEAAARAGVRVVFASTSSIYGAAERYPTSEEEVPAPRSPYGISKLAAEHLASAYRSSFGLDVVVLRYFTVFGPRQRPDMAFTRVARALTDRRPFELYGDGGQTRSWTYVSDVVDATIAAMDRGSGTYNVGGAVEASMREAITHFELLAGRPLELRELAAVAGDQRRTSADTSRIRSDLGWEPRTSLEDGLKAQWEWAVAGSSPESRRAPGTGQ